MIQAASGHAITRRMLAVSMSALLLATAGTFAAGAFHAAYAAGCWGDSCEGLDPYATSGCTSSLISEYTKYFPPTQYNSWFYFYQFWSTSCEAGFSELISGSQRSMIAWVDEYRYSNCTGFVRSEPLNWQTNGGWAGTDVWSPMASEAVYYVQGHGIQDVFSENRWANSTACV